MEDYPQIRWNWTVAARDHVTEGKQKNGTTPCVHVLIPSFILWLVGTHQVAVNLERWDANVDKFLFRFRFRFRFNWRIARSRSNLFCCSLDEALAVIPVLLQIPVQMLHCPGF